MGMIIMNAASKGVWRPGRYFFLSSGTSYTSDTMTDPGPVWYAVHPIGFTVTYTQHCVAYANGYWAVAGGGPGDGLLDTCPNNLFPFDFFNWTPRTSNVAADINSMDYGNGYWVIGGATGEMATSTGSPPAVWTPVSPQPTTAIIYRVRYLNGHWFCCGGYNLAGGGEVLITGSNPTTGWTSNASLATIFSGNKYVLGAAYGNGSWIVVGTGRKMAIYSGADPIGGTWTEITTGIGVSNHDFIDIAYGGGYWAVVGDENFAGGTTIFGVSTNPTVSWTAYATPYTSYLRVVRFNNNLWTRAGLGYIQYATNPTGVWTTSLARGVTFTDMAWKSA